MKSPENNLSKKPGTPQEKIKESFLNNSIDFNTLRNKWFKLDQRGILHTKHAADNIKMLEDPGVKEKIESLKKENQITYYYMLSVSYFHQAQKNPNLPDIEKAFEYAQKTSENETYQYWHDYLKGILAYFKKDKNSLKTIINQIKNVENNKTILEKLVRSLEKGDEPEKSYKSILFKNKIKK